MGTFHHSSLIVISSYINGIQPTSIWNHFIHSFLPLSFTTSPYLSPVAFLPFPIIFGISHYTHSSFPHLSSPTVFPIFLHFTNLLFIKKKQSVGALLSLFVFSAQVFHFAISNLAVLTFAAINGQISNRLSSE